jgi:hypothetical protein
MREGYNNPKGKRMAQYHVNKNAQSTGEHEVHLTGCAHQPEAANRYALGDHLNCQSAVRSAKTIYTNVDGCFYCCNDCHKK